MKISQFVPEETASNCLRVRINGRLNLIGEHTDYNGGLALPFCIDRGVDIYVRRFVPGGGSIKVMSTLFDEVLELNTDELKAGNLDVGKSKWAQYVVGCFTQVVDELIARPRSIELEISGDLPLGAGMSSSAALCVGLIRVLDFLLSLGWSKREIAARAQQVEHDFAGSKCGLLDQFAILFAEPGKVTSIDFNEPTLDGIQVDTFPLHSEFDQYDFVALHSGVSHSHAESGYNERRSAGERAMAILQKKFGSKFRTLGDFSTDQHLMECFSFPDANFDDSLLYAALLDLFKNEADSDMLAGVSTHGILENFRVRRSITAVKAGDLLRLHLCMLQSHESLTNYYKVSCPEIELLHGEVCQRARDLGERHGLVLPILGPRLCGGGFGGALVMAVDRSVVGHFLSYFNPGKSEYEKATKITPIPHVVQVQGSGECELGIQ